MLSDLLELTSEELAEKAKTADAETQATIRFLMARIKDKDHKALVRFLDEEGELDSLRDPFDEYRKRDMVSLTDMLRSAGRTLKVGALIAALFIVQTVAAGEPLRLVFSAPYETEKKALESRAHDLANDDDHWLNGQIAGLTDEKNTITVSEWAEEKRYLPAQVTSMPGYYSYDIAPFLREIADCLSIDSPVRELDFMKGAQVGATVGVLENAVGYAIDHVKSAPMMLLTADAELAKLRLESYITPMLQHSGLSHLIRSADENNSRKTGATSKRIEWAGGGFLVPFGARNADKLRSVSMQYLLEDECDAFPETVGKDGDPQKLAEARTKAYHQSRKIARVSTPLIKGQSRIERGFKRGDQRYYFVPCKSCGEFQRLRFRGVHKETGQAFGLIWETDKGALIPDTVRYLCEHCGHPHRNADKSWLLPRGEWRSTATPKNPDHRSYHISALYSPVGMFSWDAFVRDWLEAWDEENNRPRDLGLLQEFYNNNLGEPFELQGEKIKFTTVSQHRRGEYRCGEVPNHFAENVGGGPIQLLTCTIDVHKDNLAVGVVGWSPGSRPWVVDYWRFEGNCEDLDGEPWRRLQDLIERKEYIADDGSRYRIAITLVDSSWSTDLVYRFCSMYESGVYPIKGRDIPPKSAAIKEFSPFVTTLGTTAYSVTVDMYKDRFAMLLRRSWDGQSEQPLGHFNAPADLSDKAIKELTAETKREKIDKATGRRLGVVWHRPSGAANELWDLLVYSAAALDMCAYDVCIGRFEMQMVNWEAFWTFCKTEDFYCTRVDRSA